MQCKLYATNMNSFDFRRFLENRGYYLEVLDNQIFLFQKRIGENFNAVCIFNEKGTFNASSGRTLSLVFVDEVLPTDKVSAKKILRRIE